MTKPTVVKFSSCLPKLIHTQLIKALRDPFSNAPEGELDKGVMSRWIRESAIATIEGATEHDAQMQFIIAKGLQMEYQQFCRQQKADSLAETLGYLKK